jgi:hypothetical protein
VREAILLEGEEDWKMEEDEVVPKKNESRKRPVPEEDQDEAFRKKVNGRDVENPDDN